MAETMKMKIARLEQELEEERNLNKKVINDNMRLSAELSERVDMIDLKVTESDAFKQLKAENEMLKIKVKTLENLLKHADDRANHRIKNTRGAGRKAKFSRKDIEKIMELRKSGLSMAIIAKKMNCSVGLIHKLINENTEK